MNPYIQMKEKTKPLHETEKETTIKQDAFALLKKAPSFILKALLLIVLLYFLQMICVKVIDFVVHFCLL